MKHNPGFLKLVDDAKARVKQIDIEGYKKMAAAGEAHVLVDTREDNEWAAGHVAGAVGATPRHEPFSGLPPNSTTYGTGNILRVGNANMRPGRSATHDPPSDRLCRAGHAETRRRSPHKRCS